LAGINFVIRAETVADAPGIVAVPALLTVPQARYTTALIVRLPACPWQRSRNTIKNQQLQTY